MKERIMNKKGIGKKLMETIKPQEQIMGIVEGAEIFSTIPNSEVDQAVETDLLLTITHLNHSFIMQVYHSICMELICTLHLLHRHLLVHNSRLNNKVYFSLLLHPHHLHSIPISISTHITHLKASISTLHTG
jgi:hypothetical protein